jgi:hypothetical protein
MLPATLASDMPLFFSKIDEAELILVGISLLAAALAIELPSIFLGRKALAMLSARVSGKISLLIRGRGVRLLWAYRRANRCLGRCRFDVLERSQRVWFQALNFKSRLESWYRPGKA